MTSDDWLDVTIKVFMAVAISGLVGVGGSTIGLPNWLTLGFGLLVSGAFLYWCFFLDPHRHL